MSPSTPAPSLPQRVTAELFGTFLLVSGVVGTALFAAQQSASSASPSRSVSPSSAAPTRSATSPGGHFNPAVTLGAAASGRFAWKDVAYYVVAQIVGGALATTFIFVLAAAGPAGAPRPDVGSTASPPTASATHSPGGFGLVAVIVAEVVLTAVFLYVILGVTDRRAASGFAPLAIGLTLTVMHLVAIPVERRLGQPGPLDRHGDLRRTRRARQLWVFIVAPIVGA